VRGKQEKAPPRRLPVGNLPRELSSFVGRREQLGEIARLLRTAGVLTLVGVGGVGKTRLALRAAAAARDRYAQGAWLVDLAPIVDGARVPSVIATALGIRERPGWSVLDTLTSELRQQQLLLVLDNCEHVVAACAEVTMALLQACPDLCVLATSREPLGVAGEVEFVVPPLALPDLELPIDGLIATEAVELLITRLKEIDRQLPLTAESGATAARICQQVAGLPLAIELAAARARTMSLADISRGLGDPLALLTLGPRTAPTRHRTLRATIDWSYGLLSEPERTLLRRVAIFRGGFTLEAAATVCADHELAQASVADILDRLMSQSLLIVAKDTDPPRFQLLEPIRLYGLERLAELAEVEAVRARHRDWCCELVSQFAPEAFMRQQLALLEAEEANIRAALRWTIDEAQLPSCLRLAEGFGAHWLTHGQFAEGRLWLTEIIDLAKNETPTPALAYTATWAAVMAYNQGDYLASEQLCCLGMDLARAAADVRIALIAQLHLGSTAFARGDVERAHELLQSAFAACAGRFQALDSLLNYHLAMSSVERGDLVRATELVAPGIKTARTLGAAFVGRFLEVEAAAAMQRRNYAEAHRLLVESLAVEHGTGDQLGVIQSLTLLGTVAIERGDRKAATDALAKALTAAERVATWPRVARVLDAIASLFVDAEPEACVQFLATADELRKTFHAAPLPTEQVRLGRTIEILKRRLGDRKYAASWSTAVSLPVESVIAEARRLIHRSGSNGTRRRVNMPTDQLSSREVQVAALITRGASNRDIADELVVTVKTVEVHIGHILTKLNLNNRVQVATWGLRHGMAMQPALDSDPGLSA
jgi:non-specific serine/threonine protein kinase